VPWPVAGMSNAAIAARLSPNPRTAEVPAANIFGKLGPVNRAAARFALDHGLASSFPLPPPRD
jgi:DNA-binding NarL/FixJ family response regulator